MSRRKLARYELLEEIGRGNMGAVFRARDPSMDRTVAVKVIRLGFSLDDDKRRLFLARFEREARIAGKLAHPNIVAVHDVGLGEEPFLVMEHFPGASLSRLLESGPLAPEEARRVMLQLAEALAYAHAQGVVHRDIKPANVLYLPGPVIKLVDFGIARAETSDLTTTGEFMGTPTYMAPETFAGGAIDGRSDLFSAGVLLYQLLTGVKPFEGETLSRTIFRILHEEPPPPSSVRSGLERGWDVVCGRLLAKERSQRYPDARELAADLESLGRGTLALPGAESPTEPVAIASPRGRRKRRALLVFAGVIPLALAVGLWIAGPPRAPTRVSLESGASAAAPALLGTAETALSEGRLDEVEVALRAFGAFEPDHPKLVELELALARARFADRLPLVFVARHEHRLGHCTGDLTLDASVIVFETSRHGTWRFARSAIETLERPGPTELVLVGRPPAGGERETYRFTFLRPSLPAEDFEGYVGHMR